jgi:hypothetical protein
MKTIGVLLLVVLLETVICRPDQALIEAKKKAAKDSRLVTRGNVSLQFTVVHHFQLTADLIEKENCIHSD